MNKDWIITTIENICNIEYGTRVVRKKDAGTIYPVYGGGGATFSMDIFNRENRMVIARFAMSAQCTRFISGKFFLNDSGLTISPKEKGLINNTFLNYQILSLNDTIYSIGRGTAQRNLNSEAFKSLKITYSKSIEEQKQIVEILDKAFESIEQAKANIEKNIENTKELFQSRLNEIFSQKGEGWEEKTINDVCKQIFAGGDKPEENFSKEKTDKYNIPIFANAIKDKGLYGFTDIAKVTEPSITISARGSGTGHTELRNVSFFPIVRLIVLIPNSEILNLEFFKYIIDNLEILRSGSAIPQLTIPMIKEYSVRFPSILKQKQIVEELYKLNEQTKQLEKHYNQKLKNIEELKKSILQKAFSGELLK